jgi:hypothetical protein
VLDAGQRFVAGRNHPVSESPVSDWPIELHRALKQAETARSKADSRPVNDHGYENAVQVKRGDSLWSLTRAGHQNLATAQDELGGSTAKFPQHRR